MILIALEVDRENATMNRSDVDVFLNRKKSWKMSMVGRYAGTTTVRQVTGLLGLKVNLFSLIPRILVCGTPLGGVLPSMHLWVQGQEFAVTFIQITWIYNIRFCAVGQQRITIFVFCVLKQLWELY